MNFLFIMHDAGSSIRGMNFRSYNFAKHLVKKGHTVSILASSYSHVRYENPKEQTDFFQEEVDGIHYIYLKTFDFGTSLKKRALNLLLFGAKVYGYAGKIARLTCSPDVVVVSSPQPLAVFGGKRIARQAGSKFFFEVRDIWPLSLIELGDISPKHPFIRLLQWTENYAYRHADKVISALPKADEHMALHGMQKDKFVYLPNGIHPNEWNSVVAIPEQHQQLIDRLKTDGYKLVAYAGTFGLANALHTFIESKSSVSSDKVALLMIGIGPYQSQLEKLASGYEDVYILPPVEKSMIPELLNQMDILYIGLQHEPLFRFGISPNKLMDYLMAGKPIIQAIEAGNDIVTEAKCGCSIEPENAGEIAKSIDHLLSLPSEELQKMGVNGKAYVMQHHNFEVLTEKLIEISR